MGKNYPMSYEPEHKKGEPYKEPEFCVWHDKAGVEVFRMKYRTVMEFAAIWGTHREIAEEIIFWTKMIHNPD